MLQRIASALVALPVYFFFIYTDQLYTLGILLVSSVISLACLYEFYQVSAIKDRGGMPFILPGVVAGLAVNVLLYMYAFGRVYGYHRYIDLFDMRPFIAILLLLCIIASILQVAFRSLDEGIYALSTTVFGVMFIVIPYSHIILMKALPDGLYYIIILHIVIMLNDSFAYFGGVFFGRHKAGLLVSPNKSWEGYFSGMLFSIIGMIVTNEVIRIFFLKQLFSLPEAVILGVVLSALGNIGDLIESAIKRDADVTDSGSIIPGHGGMW
ncbi:MAG: phosphatidate cytidylyltransferase, partial [Spirochaetota bacterium]